MIDRPDICIDQPKSIPNLFNGPIQHSAFEDIVIVLIARRPHEIIARLFDELFEILHEDYNVINEF